MRKVIAAGLALVALSACGGTILGGAPLIQIPSPPAAPAGIVPTAISPAGVNGGYTYGVSQSGLTAQGYAQLLPTTFRAASETSGSAVMNGNYSYSSVFVNAGLVAGVSTAVPSAPITLTANFRDSKLTGSDGFLTVDGAFSNGVLSGTVNAEGITTSQFTGIVSNNRAIGAFVGASGNRLYAGGFDVNN